MRKKKFVTILGPTGDLGSQLAEYLLKSDMAIQLVVRRGSTESLKLKVKLYKNAKLIEVDSLFDLKFIREILNTSEIIFNFAGMVSLSFAEKTYANVLMINSLFPDYLSSYNKKNKVPIVYASTQRMEMLVNRKDVNKWVKNARQNLKLFLDSSKNQNNFKKEALLFLNNYIRKHSLPKSVKIYELSKAVGEEFLKDYESSIILRVSSCYGPGCSPRRTIGRLIFSRLSGLTMIEREEIRDFIYIEDINKIFAKIIVSKLDYRKIYNCCSGIVAKKSDIIQEIINDTPKATGELGVSILDKSLEKFEPSEQWFRNMLGASPVSLKKGISETINVYKNLYFLKNNYMANYERLTALYDGIKQKADEQGINPAEIDNIIKTFFKEANGTWVVHPAFWKPTGLVLGFPFSKDLEDKFLETRANLLGELGLGPTQYWLPVTNQLHTTVASYSHYSEVGLNVVDLPESEMPTVRRLVACSKPINVSYKGTLITDSGAIIAKGFVENDDLFSLRDELRSQISGITQQRQPLVHVKLGQILTSDVPYEKTEMLNRLFSSVELGSVLFTHAKDSSGNSYAFGES